MTEIAFRDMRNKAAKLADAAHTGQTYGGDKPYTFHLRMVADNALKWGTLYLPYGASLEAVVIAAWLHDYLEDCIRPEEWEAARKLLADEFGEEVADIVWCVTNEPGKNRKERHLATYPKIRSNGLAVFLKLCDRVSNVEAGGKTSMYYKEHAEFKMALYREGEYEPLWEHLEALVRVKPTEQL
jgi:(p)ppGpp synthase/HD superfamily hydrolase